MCIYTHPHTDVSEQEQDWLKPQQRTAILRKTSQRSLKQFPIREIFYGTDDKGKKPYKRERSHQRGRGRTLPQLLHPASARERKGGERRKEAKPAPI